MTTSEERLSRLEGVYDHLASKSDLVEVRADLNVSMARLATNAELVELKTDMAQLVTKAELADVKSELKTDIAQLATKQELASEIARLRIESAQRETRLIKWMVGTIVASVAAGASVMLAVGGLLGG